MRDFITNLVARLQVEREDGQAMVEYGLILALVSVAAIVVLGFVGQDVNAVFTQIQNALEAVPGV
jgi:Flp pilus assembly pilin Flp